MHTCIYCKEEKEDGEFNREHVIPRMMGRYVNAPVLSNYQVCRGCNSFFSREIENKISLDSYESFLRMKSGIKKMSDGRRLSNSRISLSGVEGIFKGLKFMVVSDAKNPERMHFEISPCIGIKKSIDEYDYYSIDEIPVATEDKVRELKNYSSPIVQFGYDSDEAASVLMEKGYITDKAFYSERGIKEEYGASEFTVSVRFSIDSYVRRVCAKTIFNYMCWCMSTEYMLDSKFDALRNYVRYGTWDDKLWFRCSMGFISTAMPPNETSHAMGTMIYCNPDTKMWELLGCITWFGEITYIMKICDLRRYEEHNVGNELKAVIAPTYNTEFMYFNNETGNISTDSAIFYYGGRQE
ncbi:MAG: HNH endonuclease [Lachnospiraceae bacterium]|nr:HNH endonuclease [Lachnospiraceae bacterium]